MDDCSPANPAHAPYLVLAPTYASIETVECVAMLSHQQLASLGPRFCSALEQYQRDGHQTAMAMRLDGLGDAEVDDVDVAHFAWFLSVNPVDYSQFSMRPAADEKFRRLAGIAAAARAFECPTILEWVVATVLNEMETRRSTLPSADTLLILHQATELTDGIPAEVSAIQRRRVEELWCNALASSWDPAQMLMAAQQAGNDFVIAHAYFYTLRRGAAYIAADNTLTSVDRRRLICGAVELGRRGVRLEVFSFKSVQYDPIKTTMRQHNAFFDTDLPHDNTPQSEPTSTNCTSLFSGISTDEDVSITSSLSVGQNFRVSTSASQGGQLDLDLIERLLTFDVPVVATDPNSSAALPISADDDVLVDHTFVAAVDPQISDMRGELVDVFFKEPWPLD